MHYIVLMYADAAYAYANDERQQLHEQELRYSGHLLAEVTFDPSVGTTSLRLEHGVVSVDVGPCMDAEVELQRVLLIQARDLNEAIQIAARTPHLYHGPIEIRSVMATGGLGCGDEG